MNVKDIINNQTISETQRNNDPLINESYSSLLELNCNITLQLFQLYLGTKYP